MLYELQNLKKEFGDRTVLDIASLVLEARKVYALIGPNGAGKTTLLNHLAFLEQPTSGVLRFHNEEIPADYRHLVNLRRRVVMVDQNPILFSGTVWKNVEFGLRVRGVPKKERPVRISAALERVGMLHFSGTEAHGLSGGEVKRVALARALVLEPEVLLCDEPTANVDQQNQEVILKILEHANSVQHASVIFSTHYLSQSRRLAHQTILLQNGKISFENNENTFDLLVTEEQKGLKRLYLSTDEKSLLGEVQSSDLPTGPTRVHIHPNKIVLHMADSSEDAVIPFQTGVVKRIGIENNRVRIVVDMGVNLNIMMSLSRYRHQPPLVGHRVGIEIPGSAIHLP